MNGRMAVWFAVAGCLATGVSVQAASPPEEARRILEASGVKGGFVVHLGCGGGELTAALRTGDGYTVQGLDTSPENVEKARAHIQSLGLYGVVSARLFDGKRLPYVDNLATLVVAEDLGQVPMEEILRALAPLGVAYVEQGGQWTKTVKPWPKEIDEWQQHFHGADNNAVAHDSVVGPPRHYQWIAAPEWSRAHLILPSIHDFVSSKGRLFTIEDQASAEHPALPGKFALVARDAFNGIVLWQRPFPDWHPINEYIKYTPMQIQRRLAAIGDTVYCTPGYSAPITAFEAATGKALKTYEGTERTQEIAYDQGVLYAVIGDLVDTRGIGDQKGSLGSSQFPVLAYGPEIPKLHDPKSVIVAIQADSGRRLWEISGADTEGYQGTSLAVRGQCAAYCTGDSVVCLDRTTGQALWRAPVRLVPGATPGTAVALALSDSAAYLADSKTLWAFSLKDGAELWTGGAKMNHHKAPDLFLTGGVAWTGYGGVYTGYDQQTGKAAKSFQQKMTGPMGHDRCYRNRITDRYYIDTATGGSDFVGLDTPGEFPNPWVRGTCGIGTLPCNGLFYAGPPACSCSNRVMLNALNALAADPGLKSSGQPVEVATNPRLEKGPAFGRIASPDSQLASSDDWPTYRHDPGRTGFTHGQAPGALQPQWSAKVGARASAPVIAAGKAFVADVDAHAVCALDASTGRPAWRYTTGARVDSPPTYYKGMLLFGSRDGWVYCLRASDGALAWRFKDLPDDRWIMAYGQPESAWPVCGSVLVKDDIAYFAAGRNSFLDGGIWLYGLDPLTGRVIYQRHMYGPYGDDGYPIDKGGNSSGNGILGFKSDVFLTDGQLLYLRHQAFGPDLSPLSADQAAPPHLIASPGFIEAIPLHRTFWTIDTTLRYDIQTGHEAVHGDILAMDGNKYYEVRGYTPGRANSFDPRPNGYTLFAGLLSPPAPETNAGEQAREAAPAPATAGKKARKVAAQPGAKGKRGAGTAARPDAAGQKPKSEAAEPGVETKKSKKAKRAAAAAAGQPAKKKAGPKASTSATERWSANVPLTGKAIALAGDRLYVAGTPVAFPEGDLGKAYEGRMGGVLWVASADSGQKIAEYKLDSPPAWDGMAVAQGRLFITLQDGSLLCLGPK